MTSYETNPFQELYVTDSPDRRTFVALFSAYPVKHAHALFRPGNVVLKGTQGSGKSMLLNLFRPTIRLAYHEADATFPVPAKLGRFVGAGINLTRSGALDIGNRPLSQDAGRDEALFPLYFADFINYYVVRDILRSIEDMFKNSAAFENLVDGAKRDTFARSLANEDCWFGALRQSGSFEDLCQRIDTRISRYRGFHLYNLPEMPAEIEESKTGIGEPIARAADLLRDSGLVPPGTPVFVRIDQVERLYRSDAVRATVGHQYRRIVNKALGLRDSRVWYRVGTRRYAWEDDLQMFGSTDRLEHVRDFRVIDLDDMLRRKEDPKTWVFPDFAEDAFARRLRHSAYEGAGAGGLVRRVFGATEDPADAGRNYAQNTSAERALRIEDFPHIWRAYLDGLFAVDPLSAILAAAWARQRGRAGKRENRLRQAPPAKAQPWNRPYWRKERIRQALLQLAGHTAQRLKWSGHEHVLALSAGNISIFLSVCHEIWDAFLRADRRKPPAQRKNPLVDGIHPDLQAVGIQTASAYWHEKVTEQPNGDDRQRFLNVVAGAFRSWLLDDRAMSNPGRNGFSLVVDDLAQVPNAATFLGDSADYGDLYEVPHTTKEKNRRQRKKWYLSPILSPHFQVPESHVKEPYYATVAELIGWLRQAQIGIEVPNQPGGTSRPRRSRQKGRSAPTLFDEVPRDSRDSQE